MRKLEIEIPNYNDENLEILKRWITQDISRLSRNIESKKRLKLFEDKIEGLEEVEFEERKIWFRFENYDTLNGKKFFKFLVEHELFLDYIKFTEIDADDIVWVEITTDCDVDRLIKKLEKY